MSLTYTTSYEDTSLNQFIIKDARTTTNENRFVPAGYNIACSSNGKIVIVPCIDRGKRVFKSDNYANSFKDLGDLKSWWSSIAMSGDGKYVYLGCYRAAIRPSTTRVRNDAEKYTFVSSDYAVSFKDVESSYASDDQSNSARCIGCSKNGKYAVCHVGSKIYCSDNFGDTWDISFTSGSINNMSMSPSGKYASYTLDTSLALSSSYGRSWATNAIFTTFRQSDCSGNITSSYIPGNGKIIYVSVSAVYTGSEVTRKGGICISKDFGNSWNKTSAPSNLMWVSVKSSENGQYVIATTHDNLGGNIKIYKSTNYGTDWVDTNQNVYSYDIGSGRINSNNQIAMTSSGQCSYFTNSDQAGQGRGIVTKYIMDNYTYSYTPIKIAYNNTFNFTYTSVLYECSGTYYLRNEKNETLSTKTITDDTVNSITFTDISTNLFDYGMSNLFVYKQNDNIADDSSYDIQISDPMVINATCFLEGTKILAMDAKHIVKYIPIEKLKPGMLVKTLYAGFVPIKYIGYSTLFNPGLATRVRDQLFVCKKSAYPELREDLVLTGNHSVLVDTITDEEREQIIETLGDIYVTDRKYRLPSFNDKRAKPYEERGDFRIWNLALENENYYANYGIYANGLLVETTSCRYLKEISRMTLIDE
jgi:hypothetical protein